MAMQNHRMRRFLAVILLVILLVAGATVLRREETAWESLHRLSVWLVMGLFVLQGLYAAGNGLVLRDLTRKFGVTLSAREWLGLPFITAMGNYLTPLSGGMVARAVYLNRCHGLSLVRFGTLLAANVLVYFCLAGIAGLAVLVLFARDATGLMPLAAFFALLVLATTILIFSPFPLPTIGGRVGNHLSQALEGWDLLKQDKALMARVCLYITGNLVLGAVLYWMAFRAVGTHASFADAFVTSLFATFTVILNLTPGNLGVQEAVVSVTAGLLDLGLGTGLLAALLIRAVTLLQAFTLGPLAGYLLASRPPADIPSPSPDHRESDYRNSA